jgi:hypothetical protein
MITLRHATTQRAVNMTQTWRQCPHHGVKNSTITIFWLWM